MRKIKIAQVITRMDWGGSPDIVRILCDRLDPAQYETHIIFGRTQYPSAKTKEFLERRKTMVALIPHLRRNISFFYDLIAFIRLFFLFKRGKFDIVHTHTAKAGALGRVAARLAGVRVVIHTPHGHNFYGYFNSFFSGVIVGVEKLLARSCDTIIALTETEKKDYIRSGARSAGKLAVVRMGLELDGFRRSESDRQTARAGFGMGNEELAVGFVGRLEPVKGADYFVHAARLVLEKRENVKFVLVGEGSLRRSLEEKVRSCSLEKKIIFCGWKENIPQVLAGLDLVALPSLNEAVGIALIEAQAMGLAVVASNVGGIPETIRDGVTGILVEPHDAQSLSRAVISLIDDPGKRTRMSEAAGAWVRDRFKAETMVEAMQSIYRARCEDKHVGL